MTLYKRHPTVKEVYTEDPTIFNALELPTPLTVEEMTAVFLTECGDLDTIFDSAEEMALYLPVWNSVHLPGWERIAEALEAEYNPIHNYDRTDVESETGDASASSSSTGNVTNSGSDTETNERQGYNSTGYVPSDRRTMQAGTGSATTGSASSSSETSRERTLSSSGNIGVTTSQQMIEAEIALRSKYTLAGMVLESFRRDLCVGVY